MRKLSASGTWIAIALLTLSICYVAIGSEGLSHATQNDAAITQETSLLNNPMQEPGILSKIQFALSGIVKKTPVVHAEDVQSVSNKSQRREKYHWLQVYIKDSSLLIEDANRKVISERTAGSDDAASIREAIGMIDKGTILCIGTFHILSPIDNLKSDIVLKGLPGQTIFDCTGMNNATVFPCGCEESGYAEYTAPLTNDVLERSKSIEVIDATSYREGDFVKLIDDERIGGFKKGEILKIKKINGNNIDFDKAIEDDYSVENAANIRKLSMIDDIAIEGIRFIGPGIETDSVLLGLNLLERFKFKNNEVADFGRAAIFLSDSLDSVIENNIFENIYMTGFGYSVSVSNACANTSINDNVFRVRGRHYVATGAGTGSRNSGGFVRDIRIVNNTFEDCEQEAINTHPPFVGPIEVIGNVFKSCTKGIEISNGNTVIVNNIFINCIIGIQLLGDEERTHLIRSNEFTDYVKKIIIETSNMTVEGDICDGRFHISRNEMEFYNF